jgi:hypothetical protein
MLQQPRLIQLPLIGTVLFCMFVAVSLALWKWFAKPDPEAAVVKHSVDTSADEALKYWTADKMRKAKPAKMPHIDAPEQGKKRPRRPPHEPRPHKS